MVLIARIFGVEEFGKIALAFTITGILFFIADFGLSTFSTREVARNNNIIHSLTSSSLKIKYVLSATTILITWMVTYVLGYTSDTSLLIYLFMSAAIIFSFTSFFIGILRGSNRFEYEALVYLVQSGTLITLILLTINFEPNLVNIALSFIASRVTGLLTSLYYYFRLKGEIEIRGSVLSVREISRKSFPFATHAMFGVIYMQADTIFLSKISGDIEVGLYQAAMRIIIVLLYLQEIMATSFFPSLSKLYKFSVQDLIEKGSRLNFYLLILALPLTISISIIGPMITNIVYTPEFSDSAIFLQILSSLILLRFLGASYGILLSASDNQHLRMISVLIALFLNISINIILIPKYGAMGASITSIITNLFVLTIYVYFIKSRLNSFLLRPGIYKIIVLNILLALFVYTFKNSDMIFIVTTSILIYFFLVFRFILSQEEKKNLSDMIGNIFNFFTKKRKEE